MSLHFMPFLFLNVQSNAYEYVVMVGDEEHERNGYSLNNNDIEEEITRETSQIQNDNEIIRNDFLNDFMETREDNVVSKENEKDNGYLKSNMLDGDENFLWSMEKTLENVIDSTEETENLVESAEQYIDYSKEKLNETLVVEGDEDKVSKNKTSENNNNAFHVTIKDIQDFFMLLLGLSRILNV